MHENDRNAQRLGRQPEIELDLQDELENPVFCSDQHFLDAFQTDEEFEVMPDERDFWFEPD